MNLIIQYLENWLDERCPNSFKITKRFDNNSYMMIDILRRDYKAMNTDHKHSYKLFYKMLQEAVENCLIENTYDIEPKINRAYIEEIYIFSIFIQKYKNKDMDIDIFIQRLNIAINYYNHRIKSERECYDYLFSRGDIL